MALPILYKKIDTSGLEVIISHWFNFSNLYDIFSQFLHNSVSDVALYITIIPAIEDYFGAVDSTGRILVS